MTETQPEYDLRPAQPEDDPFLWALQCEVYRSHVEEIWGWDEAWQRAHFEEKRAQGCDEQFIIEYRSEPVGYLELEYHADVVYVRNIQLLPKVQGQGIGRHLFERLKRRARDRREAIELQVFRTNERALYFYENIGFQRIGRTETHLKMRWSLSESGAP